jgi:cytoskeleton protein RodZ
MMFPSSHERSENPVGEFGDKFRKAREAKGISLDDVSNVTKIGSRMLKAIEDEHFDQLPGGVFNKGFIRAYAKHLGLNAEEAVTDYLSCLRQAQVDAHEVWDPTPPRVAAPEKRPLDPHRKPTLKAQPPEQVGELPELQLPRAEDLRRPRARFLNQRETGIPWRIVAVVALIIVLATVLWTRHSRSAHTEAASAAPPKPAPLMQSASAPANESATATSSSATQPAAPAASSPAPSTPPPQAAEPATAVQPPAPAPLQRPAIVEEKKEKAEKDATTRTVGQASSAAMPAAPMTLVIRATETSWISVTADGQPVSHETLIAPAHTSVRATREIVARIGNAAGITFLWNGQEIPAQGAEAEVKTFIFDASGMHALPPTQPSVQNQ